MKAARSTAAAGATIVVVRGDITTRAVDAIVNAANPGLRPGGGVCGAIHRAAGPRLAEACAQIGGCPTGDAATTPCFDLPADWVIHAVGPVWFGGTAGEGEVLGDCYRAILREADVKGLRSVAIPAISTGIYGFPLSDACRIAVQALRAGLPASGVELVELVAFDWATEAALRDALADRTQGPLR